MRMCRVCAFLSDYPIQNSQCPCILLSFNLLFRGPSPPSPSPALTRPRFNFAPARTGGHPKYSERFAACALARSLHRARLLLRIGERPVAAAHVASIFSWPTKAEVFEGIVASHTRAPLHLILSLLRFLHVSLLPPLHLRSPVHCLNFFKTASPFALLIK